MKIALIVVPAWLAITTVFSLVSGWYRLAAKYPNRTEAPLLRARVRSGSMGLVHMANLITLRACPSGLRVSMLRIFGPFCRDFFVPWDEIAIARSKMLWMPIARMQFGRPAIGTLTIDAHLADTLWHAVGEQWPERGPIPVPTRSTLRRRLVIQWAVTTGVVALFFTIASLAMGSNGPPIAVLILFPAIVFGLSTFVQYLVERRTMR